MAKKKKSEQTAGMDGLLAAINERYGTIMQRADRSDIFRQVKFAPTGMPMFDVISGGGVPIGKWLTFEGQYSSGKTYLALKCAAALQRTCRETYEPLYIWDEVTCQTGKKIGTGKGMRGVLFDVERSFTTNWAMNFGIDPRSLHVIQPNYAEQVIDVTQALIQSGDCDFIVIDSISAMAASVEVEKSAEDSQYAALASILSKGFKVWINAWEHAEKPPPTIIMINQLRNKFTKFGAMLVTPGGNAMGFYPSQIFRVTKKETLVDDQDRTIAQQVEILNKKNKCAPPMRSGLMTLHLVPQGNYTPGSSSVSEQIIRLALMWGIVKLSGSWYVFAEDVKFQGIAAASAYLDGNPKMRELLYRGIMQKERDFKES